MKVAILGAGNWGTCLALMLLNKGHQIHLWEYNEQLVRDMITCRENRTYLKGFTLPEAISITWSIDEAVHGAECVLFVVPSSAMRQTAKTLGDHRILPENSILVSLSKGLEHNTLMTMTEVIADEIKGHRMVALSGPCIAYEVVQGLPTTIVSASQDAEAAQTIQDIFMTPLFRVYTSDDILGIQLGGALKNIISIAAGMNDGLGFGSNAKSALITRGIFEIQRFGVSLGAKPETFNGLSGIGDLITTCFSGHSRNRHLGEEIGKGRSLKNVIDEMIRYHYFSKRYEKNKKVFTNSGLNEDSTMKEEHRRRYYSISKVADMLDLKSHILRFWESEFSELRPRKNRAGNRVYTERDIKIVRLIKHLLYEEKFTIEGAKKRLKTDREMMNKQLSLPLSNNGNDNKAAIEALRSELNKVIEMVEEL